MLIRGAELEDGAIKDVRVENGCITAIDKLDPRHNERIVDACGGLLLPGLHDHHMHVAALAASLTSVRCGPPEVTDASSFFDCLQAPGTDWLRATAYHESVAGLLDAVTLDRVVTHRPLRVQHRSGRMWFFNSAGLDRLLSNHAPPPGLELEGGRYTGRLIDEDAWLQQALASEPPSFAQVGEMLLRSGITGLTDMSPANDAFMARHFAEQATNGSLPQRVLLAGAQSLAKQDASERVSLGPLKLHLHEAHLPPLDTTTHSIRRAHDANRAVAVHCTTHVELLYALRAFQEASPMMGDRIEHASVTDDLALTKIAQLGLAVLAQPHFIHERGDAYLADVDPQARPHLYRLRAFLDAGVTLAGGSDAPFGGHDPWAAMTAAISRRTRQLAVIGEHEALSPEEALDLYLRAPQALSERRHVAVGARADLCLLDRPWRQACKNLSSAHVRATFIDGRQVFNRVDQPPVQSRLGADPPAGQDHQRRALPADSPRH